MTNFLKWRLKEYVAEFTDASGNKIKKVYDSTIKFLTGEKKLPKSLKFLQEKQELQRQPAIV